MTTVCWVTLSRRYLRAIPTDAFLYEQKESQFTIS